jgi:hypothetical protein
MQASGLMGDDSTALETPQIIEIQLKDLGAKVDLEAAKPKASISSAASNSRQNGEDDDEDEDDEDKSDHLLLDESVVKVGAGSRACSHSDLAARIRALDSPAHASDSARHRSMSADASVVVALPSPPPPLSSSSSSGSSRSSSSRKKRSKKKRVSLEHGFSFPSPRSLSSSSPPPPPVFASPSRVRFLDALPNGSVGAKRQSAGVRTGRESDLDLDRAASDNLANDRLESVDAGSNDGGRVRGGGGGGGARGSLYKAFSDESRNLASSLRSSKDVEGAASKDHNLVHSLLDKRRSYQDQLCAADPSAEEQAAANVCLDTVSKEELLLLWKTSELELNRKLDEAMREKARLEKKLALLQHQSPV